MTRYVVTEVEGFLTRENFGTQNGFPGLSCHVTDTLWNHRLVATYRTESLNKRTRLDRLAAVRSAAREHADRLNAAHLREAVSPHSETAA